MRYVALEEHFWYDGLETPGLFASMKAAANSPLRARVEGRLVDFTEQRLSDMDRNGLDVQVLSLNMAGIQGQPDAEIAVSDARKGNDYLASVIAEHPDRFAGFAAIALQDPTAAADELRRAVTELGLVGALVNDHTFGHYLDEPQYEPVWTALEELNVPLYIHPNIIKADEWSVTQGLRALSGPSWSWAVTTGGHAMRLVYGGVFDRFPGAKIILGHMGEFLPFQLSRMDLRHDDLSLEKPIAHRPSYYFQNNVMITNSGVPSHSALVAAIDAVGINNVMFAVDYPYESIELAIEALSTAPVNPTDLELVAHGNADRLLHPTPPTPA
jgi:2,3-dihydroxybenzoate decarboxylase